MDRKRLWAAMLAVLLILPAGLAAMAEGFGMEEAPPLDVRWTPEEVLAGMTLREKVGQLFVIRPEQLNLSDSNSRLNGGQTRVTDAMRSAYARYPVGGFALFGDNIFSPAQLKEFMSDLRTLGPVTPILAVDEEGGSVARLANKSRFGLENVGSMSSIGKTGDPQKAYDAGAYIGGYLSDYGFTLDFAPVADVRSNPKNTVIGKRSFGSDPQLVSTMVSYYIDGLHSKGVKACIKHFPGHGDTTGDTHKGFVQLNKTGSELVATELVPFMGNLGKTDVVMVAHISLPKITGDGKPASLSRQIITDGLRNNMGFKGVVVTDSLQMGAITGKYKSGEAAVLALEAGVDILLMPSSLPAAYEGVMQAVESGRISEARIDESVLRILKLKMN